MSPPEAWLRGPVPGIPALLQPVAHALLQCREELTATLDGLTPQQIWERGDAAALVAAFDAAVERALAQLRETDETRLTEPREVGRARLPSTVLGLLFHAAEHTQRHIGQLVTTSMIVRRAAL